MDDTKTDNFDELIDYNEVDPFAPITETALNAPNKGEEGSLDENDCTFDNEQQERHQSKYGDSIFMSPMLRNHPAGRLRTYNRSSEYRALVLGKALTEVLTGPTSMDSSQKTSLTSLSTANACRDVSVRSFC